MKTPFVSGSLVRSLLVASLVSLAACSSVLQANRLSRPFPQQPAQTMVGISPEPASLMDEAQRLDAEAAYGFPGSMVLGHRWVFILKEGTQNTHGLGHWVVKPNQ